MATRQAESIRSMGREALVRDTRDPNRKCAGGKSRIRRALFIRSTFDWAVCSEPLARLRRTRAYGDSIADLGSIGNGKGGTRPKIDVDACSRGAHRDVRVAVEAVIGNVCRCE